MGHNLVLLSPMLLVCVNALLLMMAGAFTPDDQKKTYLAYLTVLGNLLALVATAWLWRKGGGDFTP
ncbi:MAG: hypothetical protein KC609_00135, partial [Myxococcales bacterium]|nr:hypothetical protein [Myxococcales bacterium]